MLKRFFQKGPNGRRRLNIKRNHIIISALVLMIAVTGYLNIRDNRAYDDGGLALTSSGEIMALIMDDMMVQDVALVNTTLDEAGNLSTVHNPAITTAAEAGQAVFVNTSSDSSFFIQAKLNREQARSGQMSSLTEMVNNQNITPEQRAEKASQLADILSRIEREAAAEALIEAKGFAEVYVRIGDNAVDIVVDRPQLTDQEVAQIVDVAVRKTGFALDQIFISPLRQN